MNTEKQLRIKINSIKRLNKEVDHYNDEILSIENKMNSIIQNDSTNYNIRKNKEFLEETMNTIKRTKIMKSKFIEELQNIINENLENGNISSQLIEEINCL
jgi:hypothetical protein